MNILPIIFVFALLLSLFSIEKLEQFKNQSLVRQQYQFFLDRSYLSVFNRRQDALFKLYGPAHRALGFRYFLEASLREKHPEIARQMRIITLEFLKILYGKTAFFRSLEARRPNFLNELLDAVQNASHRLPPSGEIKRLRDIVRLDLEDPDLQEVFYYMLKGTLSHQEFRKLIQEPLQSGKTIPPPLEAWGYVSLLTYIHFENNQTIKISTAPRVLLQAIFPNETIVDEILAMRKELIHSPDRQKTFAEAFKGKQRSDISDALLSFQISQKKKEDYD